jgi:hypothetical protein
MYPASNSWTLDAYVDLLDLLGFQVESFRSTYQETWKGFYDFIRSYCARYNLPTETYDKIDAAVDDYILIAARKRA